MSKAMEWEQQSVPRKISGKGTSKASPVAFGGASPTLCGAPKVRIAGTMADHFEEATVTFSDCRGPVGSSRKVLSTIRKLEMVGFI